MKKLLIVIALVAVSVASVAVAMPRESNEPKAPAQEQQRVEEVAPNTVIIQGFSFKQPQMTIKKGTEVTWINRDEARHDISPTGGANDFLASKLLAQGETYKFTFNMPGTYTYKCSPHPYMKGTIEVTE